MSYSIVLNDHGPNMDIALKAGGSAFALDLADEVVLRYIDPAGVTHEVALVIDNADGGLVHRVWSAGVDLPTVGSYRGQVEVRRGDDASFPRTLPNDDTYVIWFVNAKI